MKSWKVMYSNAAESDLTDIYAYIAYSLLASENAAGQAERIMQAVDPGVLSRLASSGRSASGPGWSIAAQPARIHNGQFRVDLPPVSNGQGPFFRQFPGRQVERLREAHGVGEDRAPTVQPPEPAVQALYGIGRIHDLPSGLRELEHRTDAVPVVPPAVHAAGIPGIPGCPNFIQTPQSSLLVRSMVDRKSVV